MDYYKILFFLSVFLIFVGGCLLGCGVGNLITQCVKHEMEQTCPIMECSIAISLFVIARLHYLVFREELREEKFNQLKKNHQQNKIST